MILISAYRFPGKPRGLGMPCPRSRSLRPLEEPSGTVIVTVPAGALALILAPSAASEGVTGKVEVNVPALEPVSGVGLDAYGQEEVPRRTPVAAHGALPGQTDALPVQHTGGHVDVIVPGLAAGWASRTVRLPPRIASSRVSRSSASWSAPWAGPRCLLPEPATEQVLPIDVATHIDVDVAVPAAPPARRGRAAGRRNPIARAAARRTGAAAGVLPVIGAETVIARPGFGIRQECRRPRRFP